MNYNYSQRIRLLLGLVALGALVIISKLFFIQVVSGQDYLRKSESQYSKPSNILFDRGSIFFESKRGINISAASIKEGYILAINPKNIEDIDSVYNTLSEFVKIDKDIFYEKARKIDDPYEEILKRVDKKVGENISSLKIPGVIITKDVWRVYPGNSLASQSIGIIGFDNKNNIAGRYGLERYYQDILSRNDMGVKTNIFAEIFSEIKNSVYDDVHGQGDLYTSIEPTTQEFLEKTLEDIHNKWKSDSLGGIIMDPKSGEIYALSSRPSFDPNNMKNIDDPRVLSNPLVENVWEMGSIIKPLTMAIGIDTGSITSSSKYEDTGFLELNGKKISNYDGRARGYIPMQEILNQSLNIGAATIAIRTGHEKFSSYMKNLGLGQITGIDQPNEQRGIVKNLDSKRDIEIATASYGQGIAMTPIETIRALATLANGGHLIRPHIVKKIEYMDGRVESISTSSENADVFKRDSTDEVTRMLVKVVDTALKKGQVKMEHYSIAAKTGTAQIADHENGGYYSDRYLHSFFGYFPAYNPRFIVFLYHVNPKNVEYASETLTDPFIQIAKFLINYYELPPDR